MRTGRPPLPKALHQLHGNPSRKRLSDIEEPATRGPLGPPPDDLYSAARQVWLELEDVMPVAVVASCDAPLVTSYCMAVARHREAVIRLRETGGSVVDRDGVLVMNPWSRILDRQAVLIVKFGGELGLTPVSRAVMASRLAAAGGVNGIGTAPQRCLVTLPCPKARQARAQLTGVRAPLSLPSTSSLATKSLHDD